MRKEYYKDENVSRKADNRVNSIFQSMKKKKNDEDGSDEDSREDTDEDKERDNKRSKSKYNINKDSTQQEAAAEIERVKSVMIEEWKPNWFPSLWFTFILVGRPCMGADVPFTCLI